MLKMAMLLFFSNFLFFPVTVSATDLFPSVNSSPYTDFFGTIDKIYPQESRIIINDMSFKYDSTSLFLNVNSTKILSPAEVLKPGLTVKYHVYSKDNNLTIKDLLVISFSDYEKSQRMLRRSRF